MFKKSFITGCLLDFLTISLFYHLNSSDSYSGILVWGLLLYPIFTLVLCALLGGAIALVTLAKPNEIDRDAWWKIPLGIFVGLVLFHVVAMVLYKVGVILPLL